MALIGLIFIIGGSLGILSAYHTKAFVSGLISVLVFSGIVMRPIILLGATASGSIGSSNPLLVYWMGFTALPIAVQTSVYLFPIFILTGRLGAWIYLTYFYTPPFETEDEKRERLLAEFGWEDIRKTKADREARQRQASSVSKSKRATSFGKRI